MPTSLAEGSTFVKMRYISIDRNFNPVRVKMAQNDPLDLETFGTPGILENEQM